MTTSTTHTEPRSPFAASLHAAWAPLGGGRVVQSSWRVESPSTGAPRAFTLIELLVVVAIIALLISILLPSLSEAREQGKRAVCLANLRSICQGMHAYASDDEMEQAIPIQQQMVTAGYANNIPGGGGVSPFWGLRTVLPFMYGGRNARVPFQNWTGLMDPDGRWAARTRPLNEYLYADVEAGDATDLPLYHCPSDSGFPDTAYTFDAPDYVFDIPCYDLLGNSYRFNFTGAYFVSGTGTVGDICVGPWGHRLSTLENTGRLTSMMEPLFYTFTIRAVYGPVPEGLLIKGWHDAFMTGNVAMVDGSVRSSRVEDLTRFDNAALEAMNYTYGNQEHFFRRGDDWQMDCYPTPCAWIPKFNNNGQAVMESPLGAPPYLNWPFSGYQDNMRPPNR